MKNLLKELELIELDGENRFTQNEPIRDFLILIKRLFISLENFKHIL